MPHALQHTLNPRKLARVRASRDFIVPTSAFERLHPALTAPAEVHIALRFAPTREQGVRVRGTAKTFATLCCQMCLEDLLLEISTEIDVLMLADLDVLEAQPLAQDTLYYVDGELHAAELVEDQLLLELPMVPRHEGDDCVAALEYTAPALSEERRPRPFAELRNLNLSA